MAAGVPSSSKAQNAHQSGSSALVRQLAAVDKETRDKGMAVLARWLKVKQSVSEKDLLKIWKGLFYCMWHSDKAPVQAELASSLSGILLQLNDDLTLSYLSAFLLTMRREWTGIDSLRLDKFYRLIRMFLKRSLEWLHSKDWEGTAVKQVVKLLVNQGFSARGGKEKSIGVSLHFCDIFVDEVLANEGAKGHLTDLLLPLLELFASERDKRLVLRLQAAVFMELLSQVQKSGAKEPELAAVVPILGASIFEVAGRQETPGLNRKVLFDLHARYSKLKLNGLHTENRPQRGSKATGSDHSPGNQDSDEQASDEDKGGDGPAQDDVLEGTTSLEELLMASPDSSQDQERGGESPSTKLLKKKKKQTTQQSLTGSLDTAEGEGMGDMPAAESEVQQHGDGEGDAMDEDSDKNEVRGKDDCEEESDEEEEEDEEGEEEDDEEDEEERESIAIRKGVRPGSTPHVKRRRVADEEGEEEDSSPKNMSPPPPTLQPILSRLGLDLSSLADGFRTPEKQIVDAFSTAGFFTGEDKEEGEKEDEDDGEEDGVGGTEPAEGAAGNGAAGADADGSEGDKKDIEKAEKKGKKKKRGGQERERKVRFALSRNLEFPHGSAPAPTNVRTPPGSKPHGSALRSGVKPGPINMKKLMSALECSPSQMSADGRKKRKRGPVRAAGLSPPQSLSSRFAVMLS